MGEEQDKPQMPLRDQGHEVELVQMPGDKHPTLGYQYGVKEGEVDVRASSTLQWPGNNSSPRSLPDQAVPVDVELNLRVRTTLSYQVDDKIRNQVNRMHTEQPNQGRKSEDTISSERITVKIGF